MSPFATRSLDDPAARKVVAALEAVGAGRSAVVLPDLSDSFRADLRAQLVAVAPRLVAEGVHQDAAVTATSSTRGAAAPAARPAVRTRPMTVLLAGAAVVVLGLGGATYLSRGALPGDALYGLKRTAEGVDVSLSGSDLDKGHALLVDAQRRVDEVNSLIARPQALALAAGGPGSGYAAAGGLSDSTVQLVVSTLQAADDDTHSGVTRIGDDAITRGDASGLQLVVSWAQGQRDRIDALVARIPSGAAHDQAATSAAEIRAGLQRASDLLTDYTDASCRRSRDDFGPTACLAASAPSAPTTPTAVPTATTTGSGTGSGSDGGGSGSSGVAPAPTSSTTAASAPAVPTLPLGTGSLGAVTLPPAPVVVDSCGVQVSLPIAGVSLGTCAPGR